MASSKFDNEFSLEKALVLMLFIVFCLFTLSPQIIPDIRVKVVIVKRKNKIKEDFFFSIQSFQSV